MEERIKELKAKGKTIREIAKDTCLDKSKVSRILNKLSESETKSDISAKSETKSETKSDISISDIIKFPIKGTEEEIKANPDDYNRLGIKKLRKSDYTKEELKAFPTAPYWD